MLDRHRSELDRGAAHLGWKVGFGAPAALARFGLDRPLVGALTAGRGLASGAEASVSGWTRGVIEAELAAYLARDIGGAATAEEALDAVAGWSLAIELADVDQPPDDVEEVLAGNIYHRHVVLGGRAPADVDPAAAFVTVRRDGVEVASVDDPRELVGDLGWVLATTASTLAAAGDRLRSGDVVITGSVMPPMPIAAGETWEVTADGFGPVEVRLVR